jgi:hypothetical protein
MVNEAPLFKGLFRASLEEARWRLSLRNPAERFRARLILFWIREMRLKWRIFEVV